VLLVTIWHKRYPMVPPKGASTDPNKRADPQAYSQPNRCANPQSYSQTNSTSEPSDTDPSITRRSLRNRRCSEGRLRPQHSRQRGQLPADGVLLGSSLDTWGALVLLRQIYTNSRAHSSTNSCPNASPA